MIALGYHTHRIIKQILIMKNVLLILCGLFLLASCSTVRFQTPPPQEGIEINNMPSKLIGNYVNADGDTLYVTKNSFMYENDEEKILEDSRVVLKKFKDYYVVSCREILLGNKRTKLKGWDVILVKLLDDGSLVCYSINTSTDEKEKAAINKLEAILSFENIYYDDDNKEEEEAYFLINPTKGEFKKILRSDIFTVTIVFKPIK